MGNTCCGNSDSSTNIDYRPVEYQQRMEEILDYWYRQDDKPGISGQFYDRESSIPTILSKKWFDKNYHIDE